MNKRCYSGKLQSRCERTVSTDWINWMRIVSIWRQSINMVINLCLPNKVLGFLIGVWLPNS